MEGKGMLYTQEIPLLALCQKTRVCRRKERVGGGRARAGGRGQLYEAAVRVQFRQAEL